MLIPAINQADQAIIVTALIAQFLKELGIPSPGVTQGAVVYAGYLLTLGNPVGLLIFGVVLIGFMGGSATAYSVGYYLGDRLANPVGRFLRISPEGMEKARNTIVVKSRWTIVVGRFIPAVMLPLSLAAGTVKLPLQRFYAGTGLAMVLWMVFFAGIGAVFDGAIDRAVQTLKLPLILGVAAIAIVAIGLGIASWRLIRSARVRSMNHLVR